jgi:hypothetical protein
VVGDWSPFTECTKSCDGGLKKRTRKVIALDHMGLPTKYGLCPKTEEEVVCKTSACPTDCELSEWADWSDCSTTCGEGDKERSRQIVVAPANGGKECPVDVLEAAPCLSTDPCPTPAPTPKKVDCEVGEWTEFSECSEPCGNGTQLRTRNLTAPMFGGEECPESIEERDCNTHECPDQCVLAPWTNWTECTATCDGGSQSRSRKVSYMASFMEARRTSALLAAKQEPNIVEICGAKIEERPCGTDICPTPVPTPAPTTGQLCYGCTRGSCPMAGEFKGFAVWVGARGSMKEWICWHACDHHAHCTFALYCDLDTEGCKEKEQCLLYEKTEASWTGTHEIPSNPLPLYADRPSAPLPLLQQIPKKIGADLDDCSAFLENNGYTHNYKACAEDSFQLMKLAGAYNTDECITPTVPPYTTDAPTPMPTPAPEDCVIGEWSCFSECSEPCGGGTFYRHRNLTLPLYDGKKCPTDPGEYDVQPCNTMPCEDECIAGPWSNYTECSATCDGGTKSRFREVSGQSSSERPCPHTEEEEPCNIFACPQDCVMSDWDEWTECSASCESGDQTRARAPMMLPQHGGKECTNLVTEARECILPTCPPPIDCDIGEWTEWGECNEPCNGGKRVRLRNVTAPLNGGESCPAKANRLEEEACNTQQCSPDCLMGAWGDWAACSASCGVGERARLRKVVGE